MKKRHLFALVAGALFVATFEMEFGSVTDTNPEGRWAVFIQKAGSEVTEGVWGFPYSDNYEGAMANAEAWRTEQGGEWIDPDRLVLQEGLPSIYAESESELQYQADCWGGSIDTLLEIDLQHNSPNDFVAYITHHATRWFPGGFPPYSMDTLQTFRKQMVKVMTLAVSAIRWVDAKVAGRKAEVMRETGISDGAPTVDQIPQDQVNCNR